MFVTFLDILRNSTFLSLYIVRRCLMKHSSNPLWKRFNYFGKGEKLNEQYERSPLDRHSEKYYRRRWQHDKVVRTTHGVNCTGSCSWKVHVKDGIIAW